MVKQAELNGDDVFELDGAQSRADGMAAQALAVTLKGEIARVAGVVAEVARGFLAHELVADAVVRGDRGQFADEIVGNLVEHDFNTAGINIYGVESMLDRYHPGERFLVEVSKNMREAICYLGPSAGTEFSRAGLFLAEESAGQVAKALGLEVKPTLAAEWDAKPTFSEQAGEIKAMDANQVIQSVGRGRCVVWPRAMLHGAEPAVDGRVYKIGKDGLVVAPKEKELGWAR